MNFSPSCSANKALICNIRSHYPDHQFNLKPTAIKHKKDYIFPLYTAVLHLSRYSTYDDFCGFPCRKYRCKDTRFVSCHWELVLRVIRVSDVFVLSDYVTDAHREINKLLTQCRPVCRSMSAQERKSLFAASTC